MSEEYKTLCFVVLDGWGVAEDSPNNAITQTSTPNWDKLCADSTFLELSASGHDVGLPDGQMGNSEVGHLTIGAGRTVHQELSRIGQAIEDNSWAQNPVLVDAFAKLQQNDTTLHVCGLLSPGGVHAHEDHIFALIRLAHAKGVQRIMLHAFLDGRDTAPKSAQASLEKAQVCFKDIGSGQVASVCGRYYAMDRDKRWERVEPAYTMLTTGVAPFEASDALNALQAAYDRDETDEFVQATWLDGAQPIQDNDVVLFMNFRADRARQLSYALTQDDFSEFECKVKPNIELITLTQYADDLDAQVIFPPQTIKNSLGEIVAKQHLPQLRIAETEKYAHVTFFFNGGVEQPFELEDRKLISSPKVATYDLQPEMSAPELTQELVAAIKAQKYAVIICNYANADMVGHTGNFKAACEAVATLDTCLGEIRAALESVGGELVITADHGNVECMVNSQTGQPHTAHTSNVIPFVYWGRAAQQLVDNGTLADIAPTLLMLLGLEIPKEMDGRCLIDLQ